MVDEDIVYNSTIRPAKQPIGGLVMTNGGNILSGDVLEEIERIFTRHLDLTHMADVEKASSGTNGVVFTYNAGVLNWHFPTAERYHPRTHCNVSIVERCSPKRVSCHPMFSFCWNWRR